MSRRTMRLALMAALAVGLVMAPSATAADFFHADAKPTILTGESTNLQVFEIAGANPVRCGKVRLAGTLAASTAEEISLHPIYEECVWRVGEKDQVAPIETLGCNYVFESQTTSGEASAEVLCEAGKKIKIKLSTECTLEIGSQIVPGVSYSGTGTAEGSAEETKKRDLLVDYGLELPYTKVGTCTGITPTKGSLTGTSTVAAFEDLGGGFEGDWVGLWWGPAEGAQIGIWEELTGEKDVFRADATSAILTGSGTKPTLSVEGLEVQCETVRLTGTALDKSESITLRPRYDGCTFLGALAVVATQGCAYVLGSETKEGFAKTSVECNTGRKIKIVTSSCTFEVGEQVATGGVTYTNTGTLEETSKRDVDIGFGATFALTKTGPFCGLFGSKVTLTKSSATVKGYKDLG